MPNYSSIKAGSFGGTILVILANISSTEIGKTALLAAIGATVSFFVSLLLKRITKSSK
jgi:mannitol-specific phosphotransferase system IIBC component